jgi:hypothetical protein
VTGRKRVKLFSDVPTIGEFFPGYEVNIWLGIWRRRAREPVMRGCTPKSTESRAAGVGERLGAVGGGSPDRDFQDFGATIRRDYEKAEAGKQVGVRID